MPDIPDDVKQKLLQDPAVQKIIMEQVSASGEDAVQALKTPEVQQQILTTCKEKFPEYASAASTKIKAFCNDPETQKQAKYYAGLATSYAAMMPAAIVAQIEQGPAGVRLLAFGGGFASCVNSGLSIINPLGALLATVSYLISAYQLLFSLTTMLFEAKPEWIQKVPSLDRYQDMLIEKCKFMTESQGRGLFYVFQGTLWLSLGSFKKLFNLAIGLWMVFVGILHILIHYGGYQIVAEKVSNQYKKLTSQETPP